MFWPKMIVNMMIRVMMAEEAAVEAEEMVVRPTTTTLVKRLPNMEPMTIAVATVAVVMTDNLLHQLQAHQPLQDLWLEQQLELQHSEQ